jgi:uncharacterized protein YqeY
MDIKDRVQDELKRAMKNRDTVRLECLRLLKAALLTKEKSSAEELTDEAAVTALRSEVRKRRQSIEVFREYGKDDEATAAETEIRIIEEFLPQQLSAEQLEERARTYLKERPEITHPGKLTGILKKELGDQADGKTLNEVCRKVLES